MTHSSDDDSRSATSRLLSDSLARADTLAMRLWDCGVHWCWPVMYGVFVGSSCWWFSHNEAIDGLGTNRISDELRSSAVVWTSLGTLLTLVSYAALLLWLVRSTALDLWRASTRLNLCLLPLATLPLLVAVWRPSITQQHPQMAVLFPLLIAASWAIPIYLASSWRARQAPHDTSTRPPAAPARPPAEPSTRLARALGLGSVSLGFIAYGSFFSWLAIRNHHGLHTATFDLGLYDNIFYQSIHGTPLGCSFLTNNYHGAAHFDPILVLLSPLYLLYPRAESLLVLQSFWMGAGAFPLYWLARRHLGSIGLSTVTSFTWFLYAPLHGATMYEFHSLSLIAPLVVLLMYFLDRESSWGYWLTLVALLLVREDVPLLLCFIALSAIATKRPFGVRHGWLSIIVSSSYVVLVKAFFMGAPEDALKGTQTYTFAFYYHDLIPNNTGLMELLRSLYTNPPYVLQLMWLEPKVQFVLLLLAPLLFLPLFARGGRFPLVYGFMFCLLGTREALFSIYFQYVCLIFPVAFALLPVGLARATDVVGQRLSLKPRALRRALTAGLLSSSVLMSYKWGGIVENEAFRAGFSPPNRHLDEAERRRYAWVREMAAHIPKDASVGATRRMGPHISNRRHAYGYPSPTPHDFLFLDERQLDKKHLARHRAFLQQHGYRTVGRNGQLVLYQRDPSEVAPTP